MHKSNDVSQNGSNGKGFRTQDRKTLRIYILQVICFKMTGRDLKVAQDTAQDDIGSR